ncbi:histone-lysine N-methyltransferase, H3 lysine-9 specific SUVH4-like [Cynara cardunculus var. scolymus]|uniref:Histone H3-K9 methyltransferase, plant n=1 Tax=Cynara cardunculus var. scolymus TaxID=59895 RepID=A0A103XD81_CYNCS|nr:histone-lysine N-methyltransferase, H3 lysine-9 specific SUVH4-like [Cynara cardunculus var. scolymus]KVH88628.1 histone H3-K9 methyltransferase, plant [Cynara cardunculus var. scolymus]
MVMMSNEFLSDGSVMRSRTENGSCSLNGDSVLPSKWKPRTVSAVRSFPRGCGPIVQPVNVVSQEPDASSTLVNNNSNGAKDAAGISAAQVESLPPDVSKSTEDGRAMLIVEPHIVEIEETLVKKELENGEDQAVSKEVVNGPVNAVVDVKLLSPTHGMENGVCVIKEATPKIKFPRRRVSAVRDFPPYCGLNATDPTEEERKRINGKSSFGTEDKGGAENVRLTEAMVVDVLQKTQTDELSNEPPMGDEVGGEISTEKTIGGGEQSNINLQDGKILKFEHDITGVEPNNRTIPQNSDKSVTGQGCQEIVVYKRDTVSEGRCSADAHGEDSEEEFQDEHVQNYGTQEIVVTPSIGSPQKDIKNIIAEFDRLGHEKRLKKRMFDDTNNVGFIGEKRRVVLCLMAQSCGPQESQQENLANLDGITTSNAKVHASKTKTPRKSTKRKAKHGEKESSSSEKKVAYTGTLEMVVRDDDDFVVATEEQGEEGPPTSHGAHNVDVVLPPFGPKSSNDVRNKVRETLRLFHALCRKILQGEEARTRDGEETKKGRTDLMAKTILQEKGRAPDRGKKAWGPIPGVEVGDEFQYRVELALVGLHWTLQAGIDYTKKGKELVAVSVVASGGYDNELGKPDVLTYSGSGGIGKDKKVEDQKLEKGNLALKNNILTKIPVRVIRGSKSKPTEPSDSRSRPITTYIYDGLYTVEKYYQEPGQLGNMVYKFELKRIPGQPELALREVKSKKFEKREGICVDDITGGKEVFPICAINTIDDEKPPSFTYITKIIYPDWYCPVPPKGCDCVGRCSDKRCSCAFKNDGEIPYNHNGAIVEAKPLVYECGPSCRCPPSCYNRVTQNGMKIELEIFKTESRGWGVRSLSSISSGSFICEYIGELLEDTEAEKRTGNDEYLFDIGQNYNDCTKPSPGEVVEGGGFTIDAAHYGNVGRFINHSCSPNLYAQNVLYDQEDKRMPHIMLFAAENIPPLQELTYHYNYAVDTVHDSDGNIKIKSCYCGSSECTGRLY